MHKIIQSVNEIFDLCKVPNPLSRDSHMGFKEKTPLDACERRKVIDRTGVDRLTAGNEV